MTNCDITLLRELNLSGDRIFDVCHVREKADQIGIESKKVHYILQKLTRQGWLKRIERGLYTLDPDISSTPLHEYEVAMSLTSQVTISHWSALQFHNLTEQIPRKTYVSTVIGALGRSQLERCGFRFQIIKFRAERFFGTENAWIGDSQIVVTDLERTLLDAISRPKYCGDLAIVEQAFITAAERIDLDLIIQYAQRLDPTTCKRLGWHLSRSGFEEKLLEQLLEIEVRGYIPIEPGGPKRGLCNSRWNILENIPGEF